MSVPDEDMATIRAAHHKVIPPETRLFNHGPGVAVALVHHLDRGSPDILSLTLFHLSPLFSPAEQLLDPSRGGASLSLPSSVPGRRDKDGVVVTVIRVLTAGWLSRTLAAHSSGLTPPALLAWLRRTSSLELL